MEEISKIQSQIREFTKLEENFEDRDGVFFIECYPLVRLVKLRTS